MSKIFRIFFLLAFSMSVLGPGCGKPPAPKQELTTPLVWPPSPEKARIQYLYSISRPEDIGISPSFFGKVWSTLAGERAPRRMVRPHGIYFSRDEILYVADPGIRVVHVFDMKKRCYSQIKKYGKKTLLSPIGIALDDMGLLYVSDSILKKIFIFGAKGEAVREIGEEGQIGRPTGIVIHPLLRKLYVVDTTGHCIQVFDLQGNFLFRIGRRGADKGEFNSPTSLAIEQKGNIIVNDSLNFRIQIFEPDGKFLSLFGKHGDGMGELSNPKGVALDTEGHIYVADAIFDAVQIFNRKGELLLYFGEAGQKPGEFWIPTSVFIDQANRVFVSDSYNQRVQVFKFLGGA